MEERETIEYNLWNNDMVSLTLDVDEKINIIRLFKEIKKVKGVKDIISFRKINRPRYSSFGYPILNKRKSSRKKQGNYRGKKEVLGTVKLGE